MVLVHPGACLVLAMAPRASGMLCRGFVLSHSTEKTPKKDYLECRQLLHLPISPLLQERRKTRWWKRASRRLPCSRSQCDLPCWVCCGCRLWQAFKLNCNFVSLPSCEDVHSETQTSGWPHQSGSGEHSLLSCTCCFRNSQNTPGGYLLLFARAWVLRTE